MKLKSLAICLLICGGISQSNAQQIGVGRPIDMPTTDVWKFINHGIYSPSLNTGTNTINIPFYVYKDPDFELPISFNYATNGYRPNEQTGILGLDWTLNVGGCISREVKGLPDELFNEPVYQEYEDDDLLNVGPTDPLYYVQAAGFLRTRNGDTGAEYISSTNMPILMVQQWRGSDILTYDALKSNYAERYYDVQPDVFHFNFMGYSGSFYLWYNNKIVVYDTNMPKDMFKVEILEEELGIKNDDLGSIRITTNDGYQYIFGGYGSANGLGDWGLPLGSFYHEYAYAGTDDEATPTYPFPIVWKLSKIIAPNGRSLMFTYSQRNVINNYKPTPSLHYAGRNSSGEDTYYDDFSRDYPQYTQTGMSYLMSIKCDNHTIVECTYYNDSIPTERYYGGDIFRNARNHKMRSISILNADKDVIKKCSMQYSFASENNPIAFLRKLSISGEGDYEFSYNNQDGYFPINGSFAIDHWGYYNGMHQYDHNPNQAPCNRLRIESDYNEVVVGPDYRAPSWHFAQKGALEKIVYPTGGYSTFEYESHNVSAKVNRNSETGFNAILQNLENNELTGGVRIKRIVHYDADGSMQDCNEYQYTLIGSQLSSGIQLYMPRYALSYVRQHISSGFTDISNGIVPVTHHNVSSYGNSNIEYSIVTEKHYDGSYTQYRFDSYRNLPDIIITDNDGPIMSRAFYYNDYDNPALIKNIMTPHISHRYLRGRMTDQYVYTADSTLRQHTHTDYVYEGAANGGNPIVTLIGEKYAIIPMYEGNNQIRKKKVIDYSENGVIEITEMYNYDLLGRLSSKYVNGTKSTRECYYYADNFAKNDSVCQSMVRLHLTGIPLVTKTYLEQDGRSVLVGGIKHCFDTIINSDGKLMAVPTMIESADTDATLQSSDVVWYKNATYQYNNEGRVIQATDANGVPTSYIWGYGGLYPVAQIVNATISQIETLGGIFSNISESSLDDTLDATSDTLLRALPNASITTYKYKPMVGVVSITAPNGLTTTYTYTKNGKLHQVINNEGSPITRHDYSTEQ